MLSSPQKEVGRLVCLGVTGKIERAAAGTYPFVPTFHRTRWRVPNERHCVRSSITHPEEMLGGFDLRIGKNITLKGSGRITPAGVVTVGVMTVAIFLAATALVRAARR
jgi:hypothetical protein